MNPISAMTRGCLTLSPVGPNVEPGVELKAPTKARSPRKKKPPYCNVGVTVTEAPELPGPNIRLTDPSVAVPELDIYSKRAGSEKPCLKVLVIRRASPVVVAPFAIPASGLVGTLVY